MSRRVVTLVAAMTAAKALSLAGSMVFPGLLPMLQGEWNLTNTEAGWINGAFSAGYGVTVPVLAFVVLVLLPLTGPLWLYLFGGRQSPATRES